jgi:hypothetical protein
MVNAVVHAVAGDDEIRLCFFEGAVEALVNIRAREGMIGLRLTGERFARKTEVNQVGKRMPGLGILPKKCFDEGNVAAVVSDGVTEKQDAALERWQGVIGAGGGDGDAGQKEEKRKQASHGGSKTKAEDFAKLPDRGGWDAFRFGKTLIVEVLPPRSGNASGFFQRKEKFHDLHALRGERIHWTIRPGECEVAAVGFGRKGRMFKYLTDPGFAPTVSARKISNFSRLSARADGAFFLL